MSDLLWVNKGGQLHLSQKQKNTIKDLPVGVYEVEQNMFGFHLGPVSDKFNFPYKIYGLENDLVKRVIKYYNNTTTGNLGLLLNGTKGTGKTVTAKIICNQLQLPVIIVPKYFEHVESFINSIPQDIIVFVDEYEKIYKESSELLTIMDGALSSRFRRVFILTTNNLYIDNNLIDRPSRVRYLKTYGSLSPEIVEEIVDDILIHKRFKNDCITFVSTLDIITVDIVKSIVNEVNIQEESPLDFKNVFNASTKKGKYKIFLEDTATKVVDLFMKNVKVSPRPLFGEHNNNAYLYIDNERIGKIIEVIDFNTLKVKVDEYEVEVENDVDELIEIQPKKTKGKSKTKVELKTPLNLPKGNLIFNIQEDFVYNDIYQYGTRRNFATQFDFE